jgi:hypothetical protein
MLASPAAAQFIYVANAGDDTVSKIDVSTNQVVATYRTWFDPSSPNYINHLGNPWGGAAPSRIANDDPTGNGYGNTFVLDRFFTTHLPVLLKIAPTGGTPGGNTSNGPPLALTDTVITNNHIDPGEAADVRILWAKEIGTVGTDEGATGRALCITPDGSTLYVGLYITQTYYRVDAATGNTIGAFTAPHHPYACKVANDGTLWSIDEHKTLAEINTTTTQMTIHDHGTPTDYGSNYSLSLLNGCGTANSLLYLAEQNGRTYIAYNPTTGTFSNPPTGVPLFPSKAIGVDQQGNIISAELFNSGRAIKTSPSGTLLWDNTAVSPTNTVLIQDVHGAIIDGNGDPWLVDMRGNRVVKYSGLNGHWLASLAVRDTPYCYTNDAPSDCPCMAISESQLTCERHSGTASTYAWTFTFTNHSPFSIPATAIDLSSSQVTNLSPTHYQFPNPVPPGGQATVTGTFTVANPTTGDLVCLNLRLNAGDGWCCTVQKICFKLPECHDCAQLKGQFKCGPFGQHYLELTVTNNGPTAAQEIQVFSNTPGVTVSPLTTTQVFSQGVPVVVPLTVTGAAPGQPVTITVNVHGPMNQDTGVMSWCCSTTVTVTYPKKACPITLTGWIFEDVDRDGVRDSEEPGLPKWTVTLTGEGGTTRTATSDTGGTYRFEDVGNGTYSLSVQTLPHWHATKPESGTYTLTIDGPTYRGFDFGFIKQQP